MSQDRGRLHLSQIEPYWLIIALFFIASLALYLYHLATGQTPGRVAIHIAALNFDIYWYGIIIVGGIALGCTVTSRLALERAWRVLRQHVPAELAEKPMTELGLPANIVQALGKQRITTVGELLLKWGFNPEILGLKKAALARVQKRLAQEPAVAESWLEDAPWRVWNPDYVWGGIGWCLALALVGARLYHILTPSPSMAAVGIESPLDYFRNPLQLINIRNGGLGIYGGIAGGALGLFWYTRRHRLPGLAWADLAVVGTAVGQFVGRWANFFNQELYGRPTDLPWAVTIDPAYRLDEYVDVARYHPAFLYESLWNFLAFLVLWRLARRYHDRLFTGELTALYLIFYAAGRILLEFVRLDSRTITLAGLELRLPVATLVSILVALAMGLWAGRRRLAAKSNS
ncbi:MAG: prolipoprotein diacylglyceryl transferase [Chloroflexi bacterium]|nr:prolipoprotein diacylglyceryl transferase [Chloroflexota bacterium]MCI0649448.1 prolipoprotein diacylglyceryl transferase [Chloroflexota bacterium]MCI0730752.1 prolipoprotein diacylglyceryl transferase [Chloroflexota bacterium]